MSVNEAPQPSNIEDDNKLKEETKLEDADKLEEGEKLKEVEKLEEGENIEEAKLEEGGKLEDEKLEENGKLEEEKLEEGRKLEEEEGLEEKKLKEDGNLEEEKIEQNNKLEQDGKDNKAIDNEPEVFEKTQPDCIVFQTRETTEKTASDTPKSIGIRLLKGEDVSIVKSTDTIPVIDFLTLYRNKCLRIHDIKEGEHAENIICLIQDSRKNAIKGSVADERAKELQQRLDEANQELTELEERVQNIMSSLKTENQNNLDKLRQKHDQEMESFSSKWQSAKYTKRFTRASTALRSLRVQSILLMNQKRFDELRKIDQQALRLEKEETEQMSRAMNNEYDKQLKMLTEKQKNEIDVLKLTQQRRVADLQSAGDEAMDKIKKKINNLEFHLSIAKDPVKYWNVYHRSESTVLSRAIKTTNKQEKARKNTNSNTLNMKTINTLKLPPLVDPRQKKANRCNSQAASPSK